MPNVNDNIICATKKEVCSHSITRLFIRLHQIIVNIISLFYFVLIFT